MTNFDHDDLPPDLSDLGRRMRDERPVAEDDALDRMSQRAHTPSRQAPRRTRKRAFATSFATMVAMLSITGVAAAALFGGSFGFLGKALTNSNRTVGTASSQALQSSRLPATIGSAAGSLGNLTSTRTRRPSGGGSSSAAPNVGGALLGGSPSASNHQYGGRRLICRILNALGLRFIARILGCP
jgi:hypothetical protein